MKFKIVNSLFVFAFVAILASCASTKTTSFTDPDFINKKFSKICVVVDIGDLNVKKELESTIMSELKDNNIEVFSGSDMFPPTRNWTDDQIKFNLNKNEIDGYLNVKIVEKTIDDRFTDVGVQRKYFSNFKTELIDVESDKIAYTASSSSQSDEGFSGDFTLIFNSFAEDIISDLKSKGHIK